MKRGCIVICLLYVVLFIGSVPIRSENRRFGNLSQDSLTKVLSAEIYLQLISSHTKVTIAENPEVEMVNQVSTKITDAVSSYYRSKKSIKELDGLDWKINMVKEPKEDAWCLPGGKMVVFTSLLPVTQSEASLVVILSHNIAHLLLQHGDKRMKQFLKDYLGGKELLETFTDKPSETKDFFRMAYGNGEYYGVIKGYTLSQEMDADQLGAIFCAMAGYDPKESIVFWERMKFYKNTGRNPHLLNTHTFDVSRIDRLKEIMDEISKKYFNPIIKK
jgi:predicted Zn-dependent protease